MAASAGELEFLVKMRDDASAAFKRLSDAVNQTAKTSDTLSKSNDSAAKSFDQLIAKAKEAAGALAGVWASNKVAKTSIAAFSEYEKGLTSVAQTTGQTKAGLAEFEGEFNKLSKELNIVPVDKLEHFSEIAGQLGLRGAKDILTFTSNAAKLSTVLKVTDDGVTAIGRMLFATGELEHKGGQAVTDFGNALAAVKPQTKATAEELVQFASSLGTNTAQFRIASESLLGLGATAAQVNLPLQVTGTAVGRAFTQLKDAALSGSQGMQQITRATGVTQEQLQDLLKSKPEEAFLVLLEAIKKTNKEGSSTPLLASLTLQGAEYNRVFTSLSENIDTVREKIALAKQGSKGGGTLDRMFGDFQESTSGSTAGLTRAFEGVVRDIGKALAPLYNAIVTPITAALDAVDVAFRAFDKVTAGWGPTIVTSLAVIGPGIAAAVGAIKLLGPAALGVLKAFSGWNAIKAIVSTSLAILPSLIGGITTAFGVLRAVIMTFNPWGALAAAAVAAAVLIYENWDKLKTLLPDWLSNSIEYVGRALSDLWNYIKDTVKGWFASEADKPAIGVKPDEKSLEDTKKKIEEKLGGTEHKFTLNTEQLNALKSLSPQIEGRVNLNLQDNALEAARKQLKAAGGKSFVEGNSGLTVTEEDVRRAEKIYEYQKKIAENPLFEQTQSLNDQIAEAQALTAEAKNELEIRKEIRDTANRTGIEEEKITAEISSRMRLLQQSQQRSALIDQARTIQDQVRSLGAVTAQEKSRADIIKQINDFEREHGKLLDADKQKLVDMLATYNQQAEAVRLLNSLDPRGQAEQRYQSELKTLEVLRQQNQISEQMYRTSVQRLNYQRSQNDPTTRHIQDLRDELRLSSMYGDQQKIEQIALQERNTLQQQGVVLTKQLNEQIERYAKAKVEADRANNSGLQGWAKAQGTIEDNLNKIQENFADGLADAITGALSGQRGGFRQMLANMGKQMLSMGVRQMMAQSILGAGNPAGKAATNQANSALSQIEQLSKSGINAPQATVNATTAIINGQVQGAGTGGFAPSNNQINQGAQTPQFSPLPPASSLSSTGPSSAIPSLAPASAASALPSQAAITDAAQKVATTALPNFAASPAFADAATKVASTELPNFASSSAFTQAAAEATKATSPVLKDMSGDALKALPAQPIPATAPSQIAAGSEAMNIQQVNGLKRFGAPMKPENFVVHHTGPGIKTPDQLNNVLNARGLGVQYTVDREGKVSQLTPQPNNKASHTLPSDLNTQRHPFQSLGAPKGVSNDNSIGIEVMAANDKAVTEAQKVATAQLYEKLQKEYPSLKNVYGHGQVNPGHKEPDEGKTITDFIKQKQGLKDQGVTQAPTAASQAQPVQLDKGSLDALTKGAIPPNAYDRSIPATIRTNNPSGMWPADWQKGKYTDLPGQALRDGQGNKIAQFPTPQAGAAAQFDLLNQPKYANKSLDSAIYGWSGGNNSSSYSRTLANKMGVTGDTRLGDITKNPDSAIMLAKEQARWETGRQYPMSDDQWRQGYQLYQQKNGLGGDMAGGAAGVDTSQVNEQMKQLNTTMQQTGTSVQTAVQPMKSLEQTTQTVGQASQQAQTSIQGIGTSAQSAGTAATTASPSYMQLGMSAQQSGTQAQSAGSQFQSAGSQIQSAGSSAQMAGSSAGGATGGFGDLGGSLGGLMGPLSQVQGGIGSFGSSIMGLVQQLMSGMGGMGGGGGGFGGLFGGLGGLFGFAEGGEISGKGTGTSDSILAQVSNGEFIVNAASAQKNLPLLHAINNDNMPGDMPKFASGGEVGGKSSGLGIGERAMTRGSAQPSAQIAALSNQVATLSKVVSNGSGRGDRVSNISQNITVNANDAGSFRRSEGQLTSDAFQKMNRAARRNG
ncbi:phage tail tape measure protein [Hyphomicrobium sp.]|uniref:phage tail tape measure protein n=1 Tax=Hyphomicrobium sp. TaxID=82 RepID=UPI001DCEE018|nr:phage tail tape measure protein [Hyphomicrobium sp.]MBY0560013.1 phage tail tape measure protein [Hyphomicrobium sp.]